MSVAEAIISFRKTKCLTQRDVAKMLGISQQYLCDIEHGRRAITDDAIIACDPQPLRHAMAWARIDEYEQRCAALAAAAAVGAP